MKARISWFEEYRGGWIWRIVRDHPDTGERTSTGYRTNGYGEGLWEQANQDWTQSRQILGLAQFSLPRDRKAARAKVYRIFVREADQ